MLINVSTYMLILNINASIKILNNLARLIIISVVIVYSPHELFVYFDYKSIVYIDGMKNDCRKPSNWIVFIHKK